MLDAIAPRLILACVCIEDPGELSLANPTACSKAANDGS